MKHIVSVDTKPKNTHATVVSISSLFKKKKKKKKKAQLRRHISAFMN